MCIEELERILNEPTSKLRSDKPSTFGYSRSTQITKWIEYFGKKVKKQQENMVNTLHTNVNQRISEGLEMLTGSFDEDRLNERVEEVDANPLMKDPEYRKLFAKVQAAVGKQSENRGLDGIIDSLESSLRCFLSMKFCNKLHLYHLFLLQHLLFRQ